MDEVLGFTRKDLACSAWKLRNSGKTGAQCITVCHGQTINIGGDELRIPVSFINATLLVIFSCCMMAQVSPD